MAGSASASRARTPRTPRSLSTQSPSSSSSWSLSCALLHIVIKPNGWFLKNMVSIWSCFIYKMVTQCVRMVFLIGLVTLHYETMFKLIICNLLNYTICPRSSYPFCLVAYYLKWVTSSWTHSSIANFILKKENFSMISVQFTVHNNGLIIVCQKVRSIQYQYTGIGSALILLFIYCVLL